MFALVTALAAITVLPADRLAMADRLFDRGLYAEAKAEYVALEGAEGVAPDDILYRLAECESALGDKNAAKKAYAALLEKHPLSRHAARSRFMKAMAEEGEARKLSLKALDSDATPADIRAAALYHLGAEGGDANALSRSIALDPSGRYAPYAKYRRALANSSSKDPAVRRQACNELLEIFYSGKDDLSAEALYLAGEISYSDKRYASAASIFRLFMKKFPASEKADGARTMAAWSEYARQAYSEAALLASDGATDDRACILAMSAYATGERAKARGLMLAYLEKYPEGKHRDSVALPLARIDFENAEKAGDAAAAVEAAKKACAVSGAAADMLRLAWAYEKGGNAAAADAEYGKIAVSFPSTEEAAEALFRRAMAAIREKKWSRAGLFLAEAEATGKNARRDAETKYWRGVAAVMLSQTEEGASFLRSALEKGLPPDLAREARLMTADCDYAGGRKEAAKKEYAKLVGEGAAERMGAQKLRAVGRFLLDGTVLAPMPDEAKKCALAMTAMDNAEWRQAGFALKGAAEEALGATSAAAESYRAAMAEKARTEDLAPAVLSLGVIESKAGNHIEADHVLKECVSLSRDNASRRADAYRWLARNSEAMTDYRGACGYATVILTLFDDEELAKEAKQILERHPEASK